MSLLRDGQSVSSWDKAGTCSGRSDGLAHSETVQLELYTDGEKSDCFFFHSHAQGIPQTITLKLG